MLVKEKGKIVELMDEQTGTAKSGNTWTSREFVVEVNDEGYVNNVHFKAFGREVDDLKGFKVGDVIDVTYKPMSREYNGRWYDEHKLYRVALVETTVNAPVAGKEDEGHDLPF